MNLSHVSPFQVRIGETDSSFNHVFFGGDNGQMTQTSASNNTTEKKYYYCTIEVTELGVRVSSMMCVIRGVCKYVRFDLRVCER